MYENENEKKKLDRIREDRRSSVRFVNRLFRQTTHSPETFWTECRVVCIIQFGCIACSMRFRNPRGGRSIHPSVRESCRRALHVAAATDIDTRFRIQMIRRVFNEHHPAGDSADWMSGNAGPKYYYAVRNITCRTRRINVGWRCSNTSYILLYCN